MDNYEYNVNILMPNCYFEQDEKWIKEMLLRLRPSIRAKVSVKYSEVYQEHFDDEPIPYKKINAGRKAANTRLRNFVKKLLFLPRWICFRTESFSTRHWPEKPTLSRCRLNHRI